MNFPEHKAALHLDHNPNRAYYQTVEQYLEEGNFGWDDFLSEEEKQKAISTNELWVLQWYPDTPIGFCCVAAATLETLLKEANDGDA